MVRLWPVAAIERTPAVQRFLAVVASGLQQLGCGAVRTTNLGDDIIAGLELAVDPD